LEHLRKNDYPAAVSTQLDLLSMSNLPRNEMQQIRMEADRDARSVRRVVDARNAAHVNLAVVSQRLKEHTGETYEDYADLSSSRTVNQMYLLIRKELLEAGATEDEVGNHFRTSLSAYLDSPELLMHPKTISNKYLVKFKAAVGKFRKPKGFTGSHEEWLEMLVKHMNATRLIHNDDASKMHPSPDNGVVLTCFSHRVKRDAMPDWMSEFTHIQGKELVDLVEAEDQNDASQIASVEKSLLGLRTQARNINDYYTTKIEKCDDWLKSLNASSLAERLSGSLVSFLLNIDTYRDMVADPNEPDRVINGEQKVINLLRRFVERSPLKAETSALWLEKALEENKFDQVGGLSRELLAAVFRGMNSDQAMEQLWHPLKETDKRLLRFLRYELGSLLMDLSPEELEILAQEVESDSTQKIITELASIIHSYRQAILDRSDRDSNTARAVKAIKTQSLQWLIQNYKGLQGALYRRLEQKEDLYSETEPQVTDSIPDDLTVVTADRVFNPLKGWRVQYTMDIHRPEGDNLVDIDSDSLDEIVDKLQILIRKFGLSMSTKVSSIVNCLGQIVTTPEDIERTIPHLEKKYSEIDYKKRKRGGMRILYRMLPEEKKLIFFLHKKQAMHYKF